MNPAEFLAISSAVLPDRDALVSGDGEVRRTYSEMALRVNRLAASLQTFGVGPGTRVAVIATNSPSLVELYYACASLGAALVPMNFRSKADELQHMLATAQPLLVFLDFRYLDLLNSLRPDLQGIREVFLFDGETGSAAPFEDLVRSGGDFLAPPDIDLSEPTAILFTSGTTQKPKGVELTFLNLSLYVLNTMAPADPGAEHETTLTSVSIAHVAGLTAILSAIWGGRTLVTLPQFDPEAWLQAVERARITHSFLVPTALKRVMDYPYLNRHDLSSMKLITYGAAPMPFEVVSRAIEVFDCDLMNAYGQTESTSSLSFLGPDDHRLDGTPDENAKKLHRLRSVGRSMDDVTIGILDAEGVVLASGNEGEICVKSARVMKEYLAQSEETAAAIRDGWLHTGDQGYLDEDGYLFITGRVKDLIIRGGENISPAEIEGVLEGHPDVEEAAVIGVPDPEWGEVVKAVVASRSGHNLTVADLESHCRAHLSGYKTPAYFTFVDELPRNPMGKILKTDLRREHGGADND